MIGTRQPGFTLIELLVVVAIIAILAAIAVPNFLEAQARSKVSRELNDMRTIAIGLESYQIDHGVYPPHGEILKGNEDPSDPIFPAANAGLGTIEFVSPRLTTPIAYLNVFPQDPLLTSRSTEMLRSYGYIQSEQMRDILAGKGIPFLADQAAKIIRTHGYWRLYAAGPDGDKGDAKQSIPYDPTNGTFSDGDIVRSQLLPFDRRTEDE
jgi:prepilin-type N-terminal cleavage/methylation domain-containing protein